MSESSQANPSWWAMPACFVWHTNSLYFVSFGDNMLTFSSHACSVRPQSYSRQGLAACIQPVWQFIEYEVQMAFCVRDRMSRFLCDSAFRCYGGISWLPVPLRQAFSPNLDKLTQYRHSGQPGELTVVFSLCAQASCNPLIGVVFVFSVFWWTECRKTNDSLGKWQLRFVFTGWPVGCAQSHCSRY